MATEKPTRKPSPSDLTDAQWTILEPLIPAAHTQGGGRPREVDRREIVKAILSLNRRHSKDDERKPESSAAMIYMSHIHLMLRRLTSHC